MDVEVLDKGNGMKVFLGTLFYFTIYLHYSSYLFSRFAWRCGKGLNEGGVLLWLKSFEDQSFYPSISELMIEHVSSSLYKRRFS